MEENKIETTTVQKEGSKFGWGVLGFFFPIVGLILFLVWKNNKKKASKAAGIGALIGFVLGLIGSILFVVFGISMLNFGLINYENNSKPQKTENVIQKTEETETKEKVDCTGVFKQDDINKYEYEIDKVSPTVCSTVTIEINPNFTLKYELGTNNNTLYVNDKKVSEYQRENDMKKVYVSDNTLVTTESGNIDSLIVTSEGEKYKIGKLDEGFAETGLSISKDGLLTVEALRTSPTSTHDIIGNDLLTKNEYCSYSFEELMNKYNITEDYEYAMNYYFDYDSETGKYKDIYSTKEVVETWKEHYAKECNR